MSVVFHHDITAINSNGMPIFMDLHKYPDNVPKPSKKDLYDVHTRDLALQKNYGISYLVFVVNYETRSIFCVAEAPDAQSLNDLHFEAHADTPCNIVQVSGGDVIDFMGEPLRIDEYDIVQLPDGTPDPGYRTILAFEYIGFDKKYLLYELLKKIANKLKGATFSRQRRLVIFKDASQVSLFLKHLRAAFNKIKLSTEELRIGISAGNPVSDHSNEIYSHVIDEAKLLAGLAENDAVVIAPLAARLMQTTCKQLKELMINGLLPGQQDMELLNEMNKQIVINENESGFSVAQLASDLGISQSALYRKITSISGISPVAYLRERKIRKSLEQLLYTSDPISQVAYEAGFSSPSYFTRSFQKRFGINPTDLRSNSQN